MRGRFSRTWFVLCVAALVAALPRPGSASQVMVVRGLSPAAQRVIDQATEQSPTVAQEVRDLGRFHLVVMVQLVPLPASLGGELTLVGSGHDWRYVMISIVANAGKADIVASLGHELEHALEVASDPDVRDQPGMIRLFSRIGIGPAGGPYETRAAIEVGKTVRREMGDWW